MRGRQPHPAKSEKFIKYGRNLPFGNKKRILASVLLSTTGTCMPVLFMETPVDPNIATCPTCGTLIDVADEEPYSKIHCSSCGTWMRVRQAFANFEITGILG